MFILYVTNNFSYILLLTIITIYYYFYIRKYKNTIYEYKNCYCKLTIAVFIFFTYKNMLEIVALQFFTYKNMLEIVVL